MEAWVQGRTIPKVADCQNWTILFGADDPLFQAKDCEDWWRAHIPKVKFDNISQARRFLASTHTTQMVRALDRIWTHHEAAEMQDV
ncbi:MAG: hypothetical protein HC777_03960 [Hyphomonadaceae bacterium]|nr:hypothetical protein [Hyphomonadaceae bacterium]